MIIFVVRVLMQFIRYFIYQILIDMYISYILLFLGEIFVTKSV